MANKLVVCFDGTWNKPDEKSDGKDSNTNVERLFTSIDGIAADNIAATNNPKKTVGTLFTIKWGITLSA